MQVRLSLLDNVNASAVLAKAHDTNKLREWLVCRGIKVVIPPKSNRKEDIESLLKSGMPLNACSVILSTIAELLRDMGKRLLITWRCCRFHQ